MPDLPAIVGIGLVTPLSGDLPGTFHALSDGRAISHHALAMSDVPADEARLTHIATSAARQAIKDASWTADCLADERTALVVATSKGAIEQWIDTGRIGPEPTFGLASLSAEVAAAMGMGVGPRLTMASACATGLHGLMRGRLMLQTGEADRVLVVAAESSLHPIFTGSFARLGVTSSSGHCRPFDRQRDGFLMSEAAAAVCIERQPRTHARYPSIGRMALAADAVHLTGSDPDGHALIRSLRQVIAGQPIDLVHAHGTGTTLNDPIELNAIAQSLAGAGRPVLFSHKGALGHSLGAAGLVAVVLSAEMHRRQFVPGNAMTTQPLPVESVRIVRQCLALPIRRSIVVAAGFGGAIAVAELSGC